MSSRYVIIRIFESNFYNVVVNCILISGPIILYNFDYSSFRDFKTQYRYLHYIMLNIDR